MREVWKSVLAFLKNTIPEEVFVPWFGKVEFTEDSEPDIINISVPSVPHSKFIKAQYEKDIEEKASEICGREIKLKITVKDPNKGAMISEPLPGPANTFPEEEKAPKSIDEIATKCGLHSGLTFDTFVIGNANRVARSSAMLVAEFPRRALQSLVYLRRCRLRKNSPDARGRPKDPRG